MCFGAIERKHRLFDINIGYHQHNRRSTARANHQTIIVAFLSNGKTGLRNVRIIAGREQRCSLVKFISTLLHFLQHIKSPRIPRNTLEIQIRFYAHLLVDTVTRHSCINTKVHTIKCTRLQDNACFGCFTSSKIKLCRNPAGWNFCNGAGSPILIYNFAVYQHIIGIHFELSLQIVESICTTIVRDLYRAIWNTNAGRVGLYVDPRFGI